MAAHTYVVTGWTVVPLFVIPWAIGVFAIGCLVVQAIYQLIRKR